MPLKALDPQNKEEVKNIAYLHKTLLPESPIPLLGSTFMEKFYYSKLVEDGLIHCDLYLYDKKTVGFMTYTTYASDFMGRGIRKHFLYLISLMIWVIIQKPSRIIQVFKVFWIKRDRENEKQPEESYDGELLSFGVLPEYRDLKFIRKTGIKISYELFLRARDFLQRKNILRFRMLVRPDNKEALLFYHSLGCRFKKINYSGDPTIEVSYSM